MKRIPLTPIIFDYDLWTTKEGKCMVRVKSTGEITAVNHEVMKFLRAEEKRMRRSFTDEILEDDQVESGNAILSLDALPDDVMSSGWLKDPCDCIIKAEVQMLEEELLKLLTPSQRSIYKECIVNGNTPTEYARVHNKKRQSVNDAITLIRKKAEKIFFFFTCV